MKPEYQEYIQKHLRLLHALRFEIIPHLWIDLMWGYARQLIEHGISHHEIFELVVSRVDETIKLKERMLANREKYINDEHRLLLALIAHILDIGLRLHRTLPTMERWKAANIVLSVPEGYKPKRKLFYSDSKASVEYVMDTILADLDKMSIDISSEYLSYLYALWGKTVPLAYIMKDEGFNYSSDKEIDEFAVAVSASWANASPVEKRAEYYIEQAIYRNVDDIGVAARTRPFRT
ncbi:MAG: hypothetical protein D6732_10165 [Methanobacteriota archaeon]|nr:MAG: hypothetical protein D6732_10165 [Euryarchaeota archaeon]